MRRTLIGLLVAAALTGCGAASATFTTQSTPPPSPPSTTAKTNAHHTTRHHRRKELPRPPAPRARRPPSHQSVPSRLPVSTASAHQVQPQPVPGSCHATGRGTLVMPDPHCTPGAVNPAVTQATINQTICVPGYTKTIRPSESITEPEKFASMAAYGDAGRPAGDFEYDHLVSLELGGAVNDPRNLWPESGASPNPKDAVENTLHRMVCEGQIPLAQAQHTIATGWLGWARTHGETGASGPPPSPAPTHSSTSAQSTAPTPSSGTSVPSDPADVNCSNFSTHAAAQQWFTAHGGSPSNDVAGLDGDHDGQACESLP